MQLNATFSTLQHVLLYFSYHLASMILFIQILLFQNNELSTVIFFNIKS